MVDTNWIYGPIYGIRTLMSNSTTFQNTVGADNATAALASIYPFQTFNEVIDDDNPAQPIPRVRLSYERVGTTREGTTQWSARYRVQADFEFTPSSADEQVAAAAHMTTVQTILNEMQTLSMAGGYIEVNDMEAADCVEFIDPDDSQDGQEFVWYGVTFSKGVE